MHLYVNRISGIRPALVFEGFPSKIRNRAHLAVRAAKFRAVEEA
jgi:hypothetical protein